MARKNTLNLLMIDDNQLYAEELVTLFADYYNVVNLGFLDDKDELERSLKREWDIIIFVKAYDMGFTDVLNVLTELEIDLPLICVAAGRRKTGLNNAGLPKTIDCSIVRSLPYNDKANIVITACIMHESLVIRRRLSHLSQVFLESEQRANYLMNLSVSPVSYIDEGIHVYVNDPYVRLFGYDSIDDIIGYPIIDLLATKQDFNVDNNRCVEKDSECFKQFLRIFKKGERNKVQRSFALKHKNGKIFDANITLAVASFEGDVVTQVIIEPTHKINYCEPNQAIERNDLPNKTKSEDSLNNSDTKEKAQFTITELSEIKNSNTLNQSSEQPLEIVSKKISLNHSNNIKTDDKKFTDYIKQAFLNQKFKLDFEPITDIASDNNNFFEIKPKLQLQNNQLLNLSQFYPVVVSQNLQQKLDHWLLIEACRTLNEYKLPENTNHHNSVISKKGLSEAKILITLSQDSLCNPQLLNLLPKLVKRINFSADALTLQFFEQDIIKLFDDGKKNIVVKQCSAIRQLGCKLAITDFYSTSESMILVNLLKPTLVSLDKKYSKNLDDTKTVTFLKKLIYRLNEQSVFVLISELNDTTSGTVTAWNIGARYLKIINNQ